MEYLSLNETDNCSSFGIDEHVKEAIIRSVLGVFSALCCLAVIFIIILFKKYQFFNQRLILNYALAAFIHALSYPLTRINYSTPRPLLDDYCFFGSSFSLYTIWVEALALSSLTVYIFNNAVLDKWPFGLRANLVFIGSPYFLPLLWVWIPFIHHMYGNTAAWCGFRNIQLNCTHFVLGIVMEFVVWYVPLLLLMITLSVMTGVVVFKLRRRLKVWCGQYDPVEQHHYFKLKSEVKPLVWYPLIYMSLSIFSVINAVYRATSAVHYRPHNDSDETQSQVLWYLQVLTSTLKGALLALIYTLDPDTRKRLRWRYLKAAGASLLGRDGVHEYSDMSGCEGDSLTLPPPTKPSSKHYASIQ